MNLVYIHNYVPQVPLCSVDKFWVFPFSIKPETIVKSSDTLCIWILNKNQIIPFSPFIIQTERETFCSRYKENQNVNNLCWKMCWNKSKQITKNKNKIKVYVFPDESANLFMHYQYTIHFEFVCVFTFLLTRNRRSVKKRIYWRCTMNPSAH